MSGAASRLALLLTLVAACAAPAAAQPLDRAAIDASAQVLPALHSLIVSRDGRVVYEGYYHGACADRPVNVKSASKSVIATLVGIAVDRKLVPRIDEPIATYFPELAVDRDPAKRTITVGHLLAMRSGFESTSGRDYGAWVRSGNWVRYALNRRLLAAPGEAMEYSTGNSHLLSAILTKATGQSTWRFANEALARPLGFTLPRWTQDPQGVFFGGNEMLMTPRQLVALGELYLNGGRAGTTQVVSSAWVTASCTGRPRALPRWARDLPPGAPPDPLRDRQYGLGWWVDDLAGHRTCFAWGYGGQYVFVVPDLRVVVVTTSSPDVSEERRDHRRRLVDLLTRQILVPLAGH